MSWSIVSSCRAFARVAAVGAALLLMVPAWAAEPVVKLISAGTGAKSELRVKPKAGSTEIFELIMNMKMAMDMGGMTQAPQTVPPIAMVMKANVKSVDANGDIHYDYELTESQVRGTGGDPLVVGPVDAELKKMVGTKGSAVVTSRGFTKSSTLVPPPGVPADQFANMQKGMQHASAPFPVEPVGVGAKWEVTTQVADGGLELTQIVTYTLKERTSDAVVLETVLVQNAAPQAITPAGMPPGASAALESFVSNGTGTTSLHLGHLFPTTGKLDHSMKTRMQISAQGQEMNMGMGLDLGLEMTRK
jgi:hypothetical protein